jgi:thioredoxin 1
MPDTPLPALDAANFEAEVLRRPGLTVVDVWAPACAPCKQLARLLGQLAGEVSSAVRFGALNADDNPALLARYHVRGVPTLLFFKDGALVETRIGVDRRQVLKQAIAAHVTG